MDGRIDRRDGAHHISVGILHPDYQQPSHAVPVPYLSGSRGEPPTPLDLKEFEVTTY